MAKRPERGSLGYRKRAENDNAPQPVLPAKTTHGDCTASRKRVVELLHNEGRERQRPPSRPAPAIAIRTMSGQHHGCMHPPLSAQSPPVHPLQPASGQPRPTARSQLLPASLVHPVRPCHRGRGGKAPLCTPAVSYPSPFAPQPLCTPATEYPSHFIPRPLYTPAALYPSHFAFQPLYTPTASHSSLLQARGCSLARPCQTMPGQHHGCMHPPLSAQPPPVHPLQLVSKQPLPGARVQPRAAVGGAGAWSAPWMHVPSSLRKTATRPPLATGVRAATSNRTLATSCAAVEGVGGGLGR